MPFQLSRLDCCCSQRMGAGWSEGGEGSGAGCEACPSPGSRDHQQLCSVPGGPPALPRIDECALQAGLCGAGGDCVDTEEGYRCECRPGWEMTAGGDCRDVDECLGKYRT